MASPKAPRRQERVFAFKVLYGLCFCEAKTLEEVEKAFVNSPDRPENIVSCEGFAWDMVSGVWHNRPWLDKALETFSENWRIDRIGKVELTLLRIALFELTGRNDIPPKVALNEAVELSKQFGDEKSRSFVNGILDAAARAVESGSLKV